MGNNQIILNKVPVLLSVIASLLLCVWRMCVCVCVCDICACVHGFLCDVWARVCGFMCVTYVHNFQRHPKLFSFCEPRMIVCDRNAQWLASLSNFICSSFHLSGTKIFQFCRNLQLFRPNPSSRSLKWVRPWGHCDIFEGFLISCKHEQKWKILLINHMMSYLNRKSWSKVSKYAKIWITPQ